jgi:hypothetical protein
MGYHRGTTGYHRVLAPYGAQPNAGIAPLPGSDTGGI